MKCLKFTTKRKFILNIVNFLIFGSLIFLILFSSNIIEVSKEHTDQRNAVVEQIWRDQLRVTLLDIKEQFLLDLTDGLVDPFNEQSVQHWAELRLSGRKISGPNGDSFVICFPSERVVWDNSTDISGDHDIRYLGDVLSQHQNPSLAIKVYNEMRKLYTTTRYSSNTWNFDGSPEFLEWVIIPTERGGFNNEPKFIDGQLNPDYRVLLIGYGIQKDEIIKPFAQMDRVIDIQTQRLIFLNYFLTIGGIVFVFWIFYLEFSSRDED